MAYNQNESGYEKYRRILAEANAKPEDQRVHNLEWLGRNRRIPRDPDSSIPTMTRELIPVFATYWMIEAEYATPWGYTEKRKFCVRDHAGQNEAMRVVERVVATRCVNGRAKFWQPVREAVEILE